jgi:hypothetical protein
VYVNCAGFWSSHRLASSCCGSCKCYNALHTASVAGIYCSECACTANHQLLPCNGFPCQPHRQQQLLERLHSEQHSAATRAAECLLHTHFLRAAAHRLPLVHQRRCLLAMLESLQTSLLPSSKTGEPGSPPASVHTGTPDVLLSPLLVLAAVQWISTLNSVTLALFCRPYVLQVDKVLHFPPHAICITYRSCSISHQQHPTTTTTTTPPIPPCCHFPATAPQALCDSCCTWLSGPAAALQAAWPSAAATAGCGGTCAAVCGHSRAGLRL